MAPHSANSDSLCNFRRGYIVNSLRKSMFYWDNRFRNMSALLGLRSLDSQVGLI